MLFKIAEFFRGRISNLYTLLQYCNTILTILRNILFCDDLATDFVNVLELFIYECYTFLCATFLRMQFQNIRDFKPKIISIISFLTNESSMFQYLCYYENIILATTQSLILFYYRIQSYRRWVTDEILW